MTRYMLLFVLFLCASCPAGEVGQLDNITCSWLGNSLPGSDGWVLQSIADIFVAPDGTVYTNVPWDEHGGNVTAFRGGKFVAEARVGNHGGGRTITANSKYIFFAGDRHRKGEEGIDRRDRADIFDKSKNVHVDCGMVHGIAATESRVYASVPAEDRIKVFDSDLDFLTQWPVEDPGEMALDRGGRLWVIQASTGRVSRYDSEGNRLPQKIILSDEVVPTDICIDSKSRLLLADAGVSQQVHIYSNIEQKPALDGHFGIRRGIFSGPNPGQKQPLRFFMPTGVGVDGRGNIYVGSKSDVNNNGATLIQSYSPDGKLNWEMSASLWIDCVDVDPQDPNILYGSGEKFVMDYSAAVGKEATLTAFTANPFAFPQDPRTGGDGHGGQRGATWMRLIDGRKFMFLTSMSGLPICIYRFQAEKYGQTAIPCGRVAGSEIWIDADGNGRPDAGEMEDIDIDRGMGAWVDSQGTIWHAGRKGFDRFGVEQVNRIGVPVYSRASMKSWPMPEPFTELRRIRFYPERNNMLILNGFTKDHPNIAHHFKRAGKVFRRYDNWAPDRWHLMWEFIPPFEDRRTGNFGDGNVQAIAVAGNYLFLAPNGSSEALGIIRGHVDVYDLETTEKVGWMEPSPLIQDGNPNRQPHNVGILDINDGINVIRRSNGEYLIFWEDDMNSKNLMYRWHPHGGDRQ